MLAVNDGQQCTLLLTPPGSGAINQQYPMWSTYDTARHPQATIETLYEIVDLHHREWCHKSTVPDVVDIWHRPSPLNYSYETLNSLTLSMKKSLQNQS
ncbi:hypothetical protein J6590_059772 [Homalodisca vitripennis]|nr:hypothetical protein J6590_059772 [Homalodisca vitripennis]